MRKIWKVWAKAIGTKASDNDAEADVAAVIRTILLSLTISCEICIMAGIFHHW